MGFIDDVVVNAKSAAEIVGKTAGKIVDVSKLKINLAEVNADIKEGYEALGKYVYDNCRTALSEDAEVGTKIAGIDVLKEQSAAIKKELMDKQNKISCPNCGKLSPVGFAFCSECGAKLGEDEAAPHKEEGCGCSCAEEEKKEENSTEE